MTRCANFPASTVTDLHSTALPHGISLIDPRPVQKESPYTFELPHPDHIEAVQIGDLVKAIFSDVDGGHPAERMWVRVDRIEDNWFAGELDSTPSDMKNLEAGDPVGVPRSHVISVFTGDGRKLPEVPPRPDYWQRCFVDVCVLERRSHVDYLYREAPDMTREGDAYPDSGWRLRGTPEAIEEDEAREDQFEYVALGAVLNRDDRWVHLLDEEPGVAFQWDAKTQDYLRFDRPDLLESGDAEE